MPSSKASSMSRLRPVRTTGQAASGPTNRVRLCVPPAAGSMPSLVSGRPITTSVAAILKSHSMAISSPEPTVYPLRAAMVGTDSPRSGSQGSRSHRILRPSKIEEAEPNSVRSAPALKLLPSARSRRHRTSGLSRTAAIDSISPSLISRS